MSLFKKLGGANRTKVGKGGSREAQPMTISENSSPIRPSHDTGGKNGITEMDPDEAEARAAAAQLDLPFRSGKKSRNLSISRSGRHKYKAKQRASVVTDDVYASPNSSDSPKGGSGYGGSHGSWAEDGKSSQGFCRDAQTSRAPLAQNQPPMARTPTAV